MIKIKNLSKQFQNQIVLQDINLDVHERELLVILGESGSGKTVLLQHLIGLLKPNQGSVEIDGVDITKLSEKDLLRTRKEIGYLFQEGALYDFMTVYENVEFPLSEHTKLKPKIIEEKVEGILEIVGLKTAGTKYPSELSGGMKKRAALARSVILDSKILLCDEPTSGLDPIKSREISDLIKNVTQQMECTTVVTSHDMHNAFRIADRLVLIHDGKIIAKGKAEELKKAEDTFVKSFLN